MSEESPRNRKTRSASICAPGFLSMEQVLDALPPARARGRDEKRERECDSGGGTPDSDNTPTRKRRPATRSQSARLAGGHKNIRRKAAAQAAAQCHQHGSGMKSAHCSSEPKLTDNNVSPGIRRRGSRRGQSMHFAHHRKGSAFLDVPDANSQTQPERLEGEDDDSYRLRSFSFTSKGVINRGDSFRRRRSRSNSLSPADIENNTEPASNDKKIISYTVGILGARGVGKTALISQFMTSECINAYDRQRDLSNEQSVFVMLNGEESELKFLYITNIKIELEKLPELDAFVIMYSVIDKLSFQRAEEYFSSLHDRDLLRGRPIILVGNKIDLVRSRTISTQDGKCLACTYRAKFVEISVGINHNVDDLLVGILNQIRLKGQHIDKRSVSNNVDGPTAGGSAHWYKSRGVIRASMKARQMLTWLFGKEDSKFKNCENLHIL